MKRLKIAVLFGGCSPEYSVSLQSAAAVLQNMDSSKYEAVMVGIPCALSCNHGKVLINGYEVVFMGKSGQYEITAYDLTEASGTITNELLSRLGSRLNRMIV